MCTALSDVLVVDFSFYTCGFCDPCVNGALKTMMHLSVSSLRISALTKLRKVSHTALGYLYGLG